METDTSENSLAQWFGRPSFWVLFIALMAGVPFVNWVLKATPKQPPNLAVMPQFELLDQFARPFGSKQLRGRVWVANFIFTRCTTVCPMFTAKMRKIQHRTRTLSDVLQMVSISVDPEYDTPERLHAYATKHGASMMRWSFLTGALDEVKQTVSEGLKVSMGREGPEGNFEGIFHGSHFVLVDPDMQIRGYYDANDADATNRLLRDVGLLLNFGPNRPTASL